MFLNLMNYSDQFINIHISMYDVLDTNKQINSRESMLTERTIDD